MTSSKTHSTRSTGKPARFRLQPRDAAIVEAVHRHRVLSTAQIAALFFPAAGELVSSQCRSRLRHLVAAGYLAQGEVPHTRTEGRKPSLFFLAPGGRDLLIEDLGYEPEEIDWKPSYNDVRWMFLEHQIALNDVYITFVGAAARIGWQVAEWVDDRMLKKTHAETVIVVEGAESHRVAVVPDAYLVLKQRDTLLHFFVEIDRGTMSVAAESRRTKTFERRVRAYQVYFASDAILRNYQTNKVRVLTVTTGDRRCAALKAACEAAGGRKRYWFTRKDQLTAVVALTDPIWHVASLPGMQMLIPRP